jgi:hypothetical protein
MARKDNLRIWYGYLAVDTLPEIARRIRNLLTGRRYTFVADWSEYSGPDVHVSQTMQDLKTTDRGEDGRPWAHLMVSDTYGVWGISASVATEAEARDLPDKQRTYVHIDGGQDPWDYHNGRIYIEHYAMGGNRLRWLAVPEAPADTDDGPGAA